MGTKDGSSQRETADCDREADILPGMAAGLLSNFKFTSAGWRNGNRKKPWFTHNQGMADSILKAKQGGDTGAASVQGVADFQDGCDAELTGLRSMRTTSATSFS
jgi:hypothetical protein